MFLFGGGGLEACGVWCFMSNSGPGPQIIFHFEIRCMVPSNGSWRNSSRVLLLHPCAVRLDASVGRRDLEFAGVGNQL